MCRLSATPAAPPSRAAAPDTAPYPACVRAAAFSTRARHLQFLHGIIGFDEDEDEEEFGEDDEDDEDDEGDEGEEGEGEDDA